MNAKTIVTLLLALVAVTWAACGKKGEDAASLKQVQQQKVGDYNVTLLSDTGAIKTGKTKFYLEFRKVADNQLADVGEVRLNSLMPMPGMAPMSGGASATPSGTPGRYTVEAEFNMAGEWNFVVMWGANQRAKFNLNAQQ